MPQRTLPLAVFALIVLASAVPAAARAAVYDTTSPLTIPGAQVPWQMLFNTGTIPSGSTATLTIDVASVAYGGDNRDFLYCGSTYLWPTATLAAGGTFTKDVSSCVSGLDLTSTSPICSENAWNSTCSGGFYYGTSVSDVVLNSATLTITTPAPPAISDIASTTNQTTATISWTTDTNASSTVSYGATSSYGNASTSAAFVTAHSIRITGLDPGTVYHYQISSADSSNRLATSSDLTFTTVAAPSINPIGYWPLDEDSSASDAVDAIATNTGFQTGAPGVSTDTPPVNFADTGSRAFDGDNYFTIDRPVQDNFTICAWVKTTSTGGGTAHWTSAPVMDSEVGGLANDFGFGIGNGGRLMYGNGGSFDFQVNGTTIINDNQWHNVCATRNGSTGAVKLYVDAQLDGSGTTSTGTLNQNAHARIGYGYDGAAHYVGLIDDVRAYDTDLSQGQLQSLFQGNADPSTPPDSSAPVITNLAASSTSSGASLTWNTDEAASTRVAYSVDTAYGSTTPLSDTVTRVTAHSASLSGLLACTLYNYQALSADAVGNNATSSPGTFMTSGCMGGATPTATSSAVVPASSAATTTLSDSGRAMTVVTPANFTATSSSVVIQIKSVPSDTITAAAGVPTGGLQSAAAIAFDVTALIDNTTVLDSFDTPVTITYQYTDADIAGLDESTLKMYHYHDGSWLALADCAVDAAANTITCRAPSFSTFAIFGSPARSSSAASSSHAGGSIQSQVAALMGMGNTAAAAALKAQWYWLFPQASSKAVSAMPARDLELGMTGGDVLALQKLLNANGFALAASGIGASGQETDYFGSLTKAALAKYQAAHGIAPTAGYFGSITRAQMKTAGAAGAWW